jgi:hypothetical protein
VRFASARAKAPPWGSLRSANRFLKTHLLGDDVLQRLKPVLICSAFAAPLKRCPDTSRQIFQQVFPADGLPLRTVNQLLDLLALSA